MCSLQKNTISLPQYATRCRLFFSGYCKFGATCHFSHDIGAITVCRREIHDDQSRLATNDSESHEDKECGVCMELVEQKGERFGLLCNMDRAVLNSLTLNAYSELRSFVLFALHSRVARSSTAVGECAQ
jgi:hypothetical protein